VKSEKKKESEKIKAEAEKVTQEREKKSKEQRSIMSVTLTKVQNELNNAYSQVETSKEKQIISIMISTVSKMISNPSYDSSLDKASVKSIYGTLNSNSRSRIQSALFWNIDGDSIETLRQAFGL
jgi:phage gp29-like protein